MSVSLAPVLRIKIETLLDTAGMTTYDLANALQDRGVSSRSAYRLVAAKGKLRRYDVALIEALMDIFKLRKLPELFEYQAE